MRRETGRKGTPSYWSGLREGKRERERERQSHAYSEDVLSFMLGKERREKVYRHRAYRIKIIK